jgi:hypothetical protein
MFEPTGREASVVIAATHHVAAVFWIPFAVLLVAVLVVALRSIWVIWRNRRPPKLDQ